MFKWIASKVSSAVPKVVNAVKGAAKAVTSVVKKVVSAVPKMINAMKNLTFTFKDKMNKFLDNLDPDLQELLFGIERGKLGDEAITFLSRWQFRLLDYGLTKLNKGIDSVPWLNTVANAPGEAWKWVTDKAGEGLKDFGRMVNDAEIPVVSDFVGSFTGVSEGNGSLASIYGAYGRGIWIKGGGSTAAKAGVKGTDTAVDVARMADKAGDVARAVDKASDVAKVADKAGDAARAADKASDAAKTADKAGDAAKEADKAGDTAKVGESGVKIKGSVEEAKVKKVPGEGGIDSFKFSNMTESEIKKIVEKYRKKAPIEIPDTAKTKAKSMADGYEQISYKWNDGTYKYEVRWHTRTSGAPEGQGNTWVIQRTIPGQGGTKPATQFMIGENEWVEGWKWYDAINARKNGTATQEQIKILDKGHWKE